MKLSKSSEQRIDRISLREIIQREDGLGVKLDMGGHRGLLE